MLYVIRTAACLPQKVMSCITQYSHCALLVENILSIQTSGSAGGNIDIIRTSSSAVGKHIASGLTKQLARQVATDDDPLTTDRPATKFRAAGQDSNRLFIVVPKEQI